MEYFEVPEARPGQDGICSDNDCPCGYPGAKIPRGSGYMYISKAVVDFRQDARTLREVEQKVALMQQQMTVLFDQNVATSTLMCEQGARKRGLDLDVAAADAKYWWETGLIPLRATPLAGSTETRKENEQPSSGQSSPEKIPVAPLQASGDGIITTEFQGRKKLLASGVMLLIGFFADLIPCGGWLAGGIAAVVWIQWEKTLPANATKRGAVAGLLAGVGTFLAMGVSISINLYKTVEPASYPATLFVEVLIFFLFSLPLAILTGALTGHLIGRKGKPKEGGVAASRSAMPSSAPSSSFPSHAVEQPTGDYSSDSVKGLLKAHIVRLNGMYRGKPDEQESLRFIQQVLNNDLLTFAVDQMAQKIPEALAEKKVLQSTGTFGDWFMAVTISPWFKPEDVKANLGQEYMELLNDLAGPALNTTGGKNIAHWVYCSNGNQASVHLTMMPNPKGSSKGTVVLAQDLLTPQERQKVGLPPQGSVSTYVESPRKPVPGTCYQCHKSLQGISAGAYSGSNMVDMMERIPYACKSCGTDFCINCMSEIKKETNKTCPYCGRNIGW